VFEKPEKIIGEQKAYNALILICLANIAASAVYLVVCEYISRYALPSGQKTFLGYAPLNDLKYNLARIFMLFVTLQVTVAVIGMKAAIEKGSSSGIIKSLLDHQIISPDELTIQVVQKFLVFVYALCSSITIYGLVLFLLNGHKPDSYAFIIFGALLSLLLLPTDEFMNKVIIFRENEREKSKCPACRVYVPPKAKFCGQCGRERVKAQA
jgi:hypothetical protein